MESVTSVAVKVGDPIFEDFTVKVTTPELSDAPDAAEIVSLDPRLDARLTVFPSTGFPRLSMRVTVTVDVEVPSAVTVKGEAETVDREALPGPAVNWTGTVLGSGLEPTEAV